MKTFFKFLALVILLNVIRYSFSYLPLEQMAFLPMMSVMDTNPSYFNMNFSASEWATSYLYNFMMWLAFTWVYMLLQPRLKGHPVVRALKVYGLMFFIFVSISAIYMNHYSHPKEFYLYSIFDALIVFPVVAVATGLLYPILFKPDTASQPPNT